MPTIYDNIEQALLAGLREALRVSRCADICVGYFNLRGWGGIAAQVEALAAPEDRPACRLIVGMASDPDRAVRAHYAHSDKPVDQRQVVAEKNRFAKALARQLTYGVPTAGDQTALGDLARQLRAGRLAVKFFGRHPLHAKLYLAHRDDAINPVIGFVGSSNLTLPGLARQGELNVDVLDKDAAHKLAHWFEERWDDKWCLDITEELAAIIEESWAGGPVSPYEIYLKTAYELSKEAIAGEREFRVPKEFQKIMPEFQQRAVSLAAERLNRHNGVIIGDVVGLGKTLIASAVAKTFQQDQGVSVLVICPPNLREMWDEYLHKYQIAGDTHSLGATGKLRGMPRYKLLVIDESHNLRNRDSKRHAHIHDYIRDNDSRVVLLSATPYNKSFEDIGNQLRLFIDPGESLDVRPDAYIRACGGADRFRSEHPNTLLSSLSAFEKSGHVDDWRELMRMFMVRRTRSHIKKNYAEYDEEKKKHYLVYGEDQRFYFPPRVAKCARFGLDENDARDRYAALYFPDVVDTITGLNLPRYGLRQYLRDEYSGGKPAVPLSEKEQAIVKNLSRAGKRLRGFAKSGLFKRLESSGPAFLLSIRRHIVRNAVYLSALERERGRLPIGDVFAAGLIDEGVEESDQALFAPPDGADLDRFLQAGKKVYDSLRADRRAKKFDWIAAEAFAETLARELRQDCDALLAILRISPEWDAAADRKLNALVKLCTTTHGDEKILIFTQFRATAEYLSREFQRRGIARAAMVHGGTENVLQYVNRFSPPQEQQDSGQLDDLRILIATDTLSEGQNLQRAHIVVNFDLPWAIIRLIQRVGRVDRIGQENTIYCYCFLPEEGINKVIDLRGRLQARLQENAELIGSDEQFFEGDRVNLQHAYDEQLDLDGEDETDLISRCYAIWLQATKNDDALRKKIEALPDVVYSAKALPAKESSASGLLAYIKTSHQQHILVRMDERGEVVSHSQSKILDLLACEKDERQATPAATHFDLLQRAVAHVRSDEAGSVGGALGGPRSVRNRVYSGIKRALERHQGTLFESPPNELKEALQLIYRWPLKETARDRLGRQLRAGISDQDLAQMVQDLWQANDLCMVSKSDEPPEPRIVCSMGLCAAPRLPGGGEPCDNAGEATQDRRPRSPPKITARSAAIKPPAND